jgi:hypothetical protein
MAFLVRRRGAGASKLGSPTANNSDRVLVDLLLKNGPQVLGPGGIPLGLGDLVDLA